MFPRLKSAIFCAAQILCLLSLASCADTKWPTWVTGEPDESVTNAPRLVGTAPSHDLKKWRNLADVPAKPTDFSTVEARGTIIHDMTDDKNEAEALRQRVASEPQPTPLKP